MTDHSPQDKARTTGDHLETAVSNVSDMAYRKVEDLTKTATERAADEMADAASATTAASTSFDPEGPQAQMADQLAAGLGDLAGALRDTDLDAVTRKVTHVARENPVLFLGGAALLGFAAARFLKSSDTAPAAVARNPSDDPWTGHVTGHVTGHTPRRASDVKTERSV